MTISTQICKHIYVADGENRQWEIDFPFLSSQDIVLYVTAPDGTQTQVSAGYEIQLENLCVIYPTLASGQAPLAQGYTLTLLRKTPLTQEISLTQQGVLDAKELENGYDKLTLQLQEMQEQLARGIQYPVSSNHTTTDAQAFLTQLKAEQTAALTQTLEDVESTRQVLVDQMQTESTARTQADIALQQSVQTLVGIVSQNDATHSAQITALEENLSQKQNELNNSQLLAVNSGVTSQTVSQVQANKENIAALDEEIAEDRPWQTPSDWIDIRSGALSNSVYFLVGHSADFSKYPKFLINATISNSGTYDVFVDGVKQATTASGTATTLNWQTLALESGWDVTYPEQLRTHIVRVTPTTSSNTLSSIKIPSTEAIEFGLLWVHFSISYAININSFLKEAFAGGYCYLLEAITANGDELNVTGDMEGSFALSRALKTIPTLVGNGSVVNCNRMFQSSSVPVIKLKNILLNGDQVFWSCSNLKKIETQNSFVATRGYVFDSTSSLIKLPPLYHPNTSRAIVYFLRNCTKLKDTCLDFSGDNAITSLQIGGRSNTRIDGLKALTVSNEAPFSNTTSPQIDVSYTGLDRQALVNLFKSMPTVSAGQVCNITGATGAADLTAEDLAIATEKGWTITR